MPDSNGTDIGGGKGSTDGGDGQGIRPVSGQKNTYTVWGELTLPAGVTIPEGAVLTGSGSLNEGSKLNQSAPGAPILSVTTSNSVTLKAPADAVSEKTLQYGYTTGSQSTDNIGWQDSSTFTGLTSGATYTFYARYKDDNFHKPSPPSSQGLEVTLKHDSTVTVAMGKGGLSTTTAVYGDTIMLKAAIAQVNATTRAATPNTVEFFVGTGEGKKSLGTADVTNNQATLSVTLSGENWAKGWVIGENTITSEYGGDDTMNGSSGTTTVTVNAAPLSAPDNVTLASSASGKAMAAWGAVTNASGYSVQLYKDSSAQGEAVTVDASKTSQEFTITEASSYTVKVKATGSRYYAAGPETESVSLTFHTVSFDTNDGDTAPDTQIIAQNSKATEPAKPSKAGYDFDGWWTSDDKQWKFDTDTVTSNMTLQAHWTQDTPAPPTPPTPTPSPTYQGIQVTGKPSRTEYEVGEELDLTGLVVREHWSDGSSRTLSASEYTVSGFDSSEPGEKTLTVTLKRDTNRTATFTVTVTAAPVTVHRLYNTLTGEHLYTANTQERDHLAANGWRYEGVAFTMSSHGTPVHRLYLPGGKHMFTTSETEYEHLKHTGWRDEGIAFHAPEDGATPVWRLYNPANGDHLLTTNPTERAALPTQNWRDEGTAFVSH